jgi:hypothetical protein
MKIKPTIPKNNVGQSQAQYREMDLLFQAIFK